MNKHDLASDAAATYSLQYLLDEGGTPSPEQAATWIGKLETLSESEILRLHGDIEALKGFLSSAPTSKKEMPTATAPPTALPTGMPTWCKSIFVIDIIILLLTCISVLSVFTKGWQTNVASFGKDPAILQSAMANTVITAVLILCGMTANLLLLRLNRKGFFLGVLSLLLVVLALIVQGWGTSHHDFKDAMSFFVMIAIARVIYNGVYLVALLRVRQMFK